MYTIGRKHRIQTVGRKPLRKPEPYIGSSNLQEEEGGVLTFEKTHNPIITHIINLV